MYRAIDCDLWLATRWKIVRMIFFYSRRRACFSHSQYSQQSFMLVFFFPPPHNLHRSNCWLQKLVSSSTAATVVSCGAEIFQRVASWICGEKLKVLRELSEFRFRVNNLKFLWHFLLCNFPIVKIQLFCPYKYFSTRQQQEIFFLISLLFFLVLGCMQKDNKRLSVLFSVETAFVGGRRKFAGEEYFQFQLQVGSASYRKKKSESVKSYQKVSMWWTGVVLFYFSHIHVKCEVNRWWVSTRFNW